MSTKIFGIFIASGSAIGIAILGGIFAYLFLVSEKQDIVIAAFAEMNRTTTEALTSLSVQQAHTQEEFAEVQIQFLDVTKKQVSVMARLVKVIEDVEKNQLAIEATKVKFREFENNQYKNFDHGEDHKNEP